MVWVGACVLGVHFLGFYSKPYFRDFACTFAAGYRILLGQVPFRDFFIPMSPLSYYIQALFFRLFGVNLGAVFWHSGFFSVILCLAFYSVIRSRLGAAYSVLFAIGMYFSYNGLFSYPFYSVSAPYFFVVLSYVVLLDEILSTRLKRYVPALVGILCFGAIFSKQDVGLMHFFLMLGYVVMYRRSSLKDLGSFLGAFLLLGVPTVVGFHFKADLFAHLYLLQGTGQKLDLLNGSYFRMGPFYLLLGVVGVMVWRRDFFDRKLGLIGVNLVLVLVSAQVSSSIHAILIQGMPVILVLLIYYFQPIFSSIGVQKLSAIASVVLVVSTSMIPLSIRYIVGNTIYPLFSESVPSWVSVAESDFKKETLKSGRDVLSKMRRIVRDGAISVLPYSRLQNSTYGGVLVHEKDRKIISEMQALISKHRAQFVHFTEFRFLYADFNVEPPKSMPLVFNDGLYFFEQDIPGMWEAILASGATLVLMQHAESEDVLDRFDSFLVDNGFVLVKTVVPYSGSPIDVYER